MKLLHTSDWHLGMPLRAGSLTEDHRFFLQQLYSLIKEENIDAVLVAGDIYDSSVTNAEAIELYNEAVTNICITLGCKMVVIAGNHDSAARLAACRELLKPAGLYVTGKLTRNIAPVRLGNADIYPIPFFNRDEVIALFPEKKEGISTQEDASEVVCENLRQNLDPQRVSIAVAHAYITGAALSDSDRAAQVGTASAVSKDVFRGFDYAALGHIHKPQVISETVRYSGSPLKFSFGAEEVQTKQVILYDTDTKEQKVTPLALLHDRKSVTGTYAEITALQGLKDVYLRLTVTDRIAGLELFSELKDRFPCLLELYGKSLEASGSATAVTIEELEKMDETDILLRFLAEQYQYEPGERQLGLFRSVLEECAKEEAGE